MSTILNAANELANLQLVSNKAGDFMNDLAALNTVSAQHAYATYMEAIKAVAAAEHAMYAAARDEQLQGETLHNGD